MARRLVERNKDPEVVRMMKEHNKRVHDAFSRAKAGETISLTDLMISRENVEEKMAEISHSAMRVKGGR